MDLNQSGETIRHIFLGSLMPFIDSTGEISKEVCVGEKDDLKRMECGFLVNAGDLPFWWPLSSFPSLVFLRS